MFSSIVDHNKQLKLFYVQLQASLSSAQNAEDLYQIVEQAQDIGRPLKYNNTIIFSMIGILILMSLLFSLFIESNRFIAFPAAIIIALGVYAFKRQRSFSTLSQQIFTKKLLLDNAIAPQSFHVSSLTSNLLHRFKDFSRGNDTREVQSLYAGKYQGKEHQFQYHYYKYHYVVREEETETDSEGNSKTVTKYYHYYRYGVFLDFPYVASLSLDKPTLLFNKGIYRPASNQFNRYYTVHGESEISAAKFLKPMIVKAFEDIHAHFSAIHFEFNHNNELCMSFDNDDTLYLKRKYGFDDISHFLTELKQPLILTRLNMILNHIDGLMTYSDNNFETNN